MRKSGVAEKYVRVVQDVYERSRTVVRCAVGQTEEFKVEVGLHQGSALSPFLLAMVMDQLSEEVRQESPCTMMFADDIVICSESREQVEENLERWRFALERRGMKVSRSKTEYMCVNEREGSGTVRLQGEEVKKVQEFKYLESTVQSNGECGKEVKKRVQAVWNGWRKVSGALCDRKISARIKGKVYKTVVRAAMLYGLETVALRKRQESELEVILNCSALPCLLHLLSSPKESIKKEACWTVSNITAGNRAQIQTVIDANIFPVLIEILQKAEFRTRKEAAWAITNATSGGTPEQIRYLVSLNCIKPMCDLLTVMDSKIVQVSLNGLENILRLGEQESKQNGTGINPYCALIEEAYGLDKIEFLQSHENQEIYQKAFDLIEHYFGVEEEDANIAPQVDQNQDQYIFQQHHGPMDHFQL
ncbi:hypothetical protein PDJAM_G00107580 [Pangasius djambal]|uniref:Uncharacterized protein n=1 Tax=Pangasius djambal TaxID=1691987 RepID=A0ACC5Y1U7_9TELE|nr:hypothetical protein [Pangasius djambal]